MTTTTPALSDEALGALARSTRVFALPQYRLMYVSLAKNACTALKWMMADLAGEDAAHFTLGLRPYTDAMDVIHDRKQWRNVPVLSELPPDVRAGIHPDNGWLIFSVVRDPRPRLFSGWQNKLLLNSPTHMKWSAEPWYPRFPQDQETIVEDFAKFVDMLRRNPKHPLHWDTHFRSQTRLLRRDKFPYSRIYDISEMRQLRADVTAHLASFGWSGELYLPRSNESPLRPIAALFAAPVREQVETIYASDFKRFGRRWDFAAIADEKWSDEMLADAQRMASAGRRMTELRTIALAQRRELGQLRNELRLARVGVPVKVVRAARPRLRRSYEALHRRAPRLAERLRAALRRRPRPLDPNSRSAHRGS